MPSTTLERYLMVSYCTQPISSTLHTTNRAPYTGRSRTVLMRASSATFKNVPYSAHGMDERLTFRRIELATQPADVHFDDIGAVVEVITPHGFEDHGSRQHAATVTHEKFEQLEFGGQQIEQHAAAARGAIDQIELEIADSQSH